MNGAKTAGAGLGAIVGTVLVALGTRIGLDLTNVDSAVLGMGAVAVFVGIGHAIGENGIAGIFRMLWRGRPKPTSESGRMIVGLLLALTFVSALVIVVAAAAVAASPTKPRAQQHYANFGPWCVSLHDGTPRFIATNQSCYSKKTIRDGKTYWPEVRVKHQRIPLDPQPGPRGPRGADGTGVAVAPEPPGVNCPRGGIKVTTASGANYVCNGLTGPAGVGTKGDPGTPGAPGAAGRDGNDGTDGLGDGTRWFCWDGQHGHGFADGGDGAQPDCNGGTKAAIPVVTAGPVLYLK